MHTDAIFAGFGGQGIMLIGQLLAYAGMEEGKEVVWLPSYGPEMRGGTANVIVRLSPDPIGSPFISDPRALLVMNLPSLEKFAPAVRPGGVIIVNRSLVSRDAGRDDCRVVYLDAREIAIDVGSPRAANFVMLGAYLGASGVLPSATVEQALAGEFTGRKASKIYRRQARDSAVARPSGR